VGCVQSVGDLDADFYQSVLYGTTIDGGQAKPDSLRSNSVMWRARIHWRTGTLMKKTESRSKVLGRLSHDTAWPEHVTASGEGQTAFYKEKVLYSFQSGPRDGAFPKGGLVRARWTFYGTTYSGGPVSDSCGFSNRDAEPYTNWMPRVTSSAAFL